MLIVFEVYRHLDPVRFYVSAGFTETRDAGHNDGGRGCYIILGHLGCFYIFYTILSEIHTVLKIFTIPNYDEITKYRSRFTIP